MRKIILLLTITFVITSCTVKYPILKVANSVDYSVYMQDGFFITEANSVSFNYKPVGNVSILLSDGWEIIRGEKESGVYSMAEIGSIRYGQYKEVHRDEALKHLVEKAKEMGADGIINLQFEYIMKQYDKHGIADGREYVRATGMAIKQ